MNSELIVLQVCEINTSTRWPKWIRAKIINYKFNKMLKSGTYKPDKSENVPEQGEYLAPVEPHGNKQIWRHKGVIYERKKTKDGWTRWRKNVY